MSDATKSRPVYFHTGAQYATDAQGAAGFKVFVHLDDTNDLLAVLDAASPGSELARTLASRVRSCIASNRLRLESPAKA